MIGLKYVAVTVAFVILAIIGLAMLVAIGVELGRWLGRDDR